MTDDWPQIKARLAADAAALAALPQNLDKRAGEEFAADIRAALQRVEFWETANKRMSEEELEAECKSCAALRQRVSEHEANARMMICLWCGEAFDAGVSPLQAQGDHSLLAPAYEWATTHDRACAKNPLRQRVEELEKDLAQSASDEMRLYERAEAAEAKLFSLTYENKLLWDKAEAAEAKLARVVEAVEAVRKQNTEDADMDWADAADTVCDEILAAAKGDK